MHILQIIVLFKRRAVYIKGCYFQFCFVVFGEYRITFLKDIYYIFEEKMYIFEGHRLHADMYHVFVINIPNIAKRGHVMYYCNGMLYHAHVEGNTHFKEMRHYFQEFANPKGEKWQRVRSWHFFGFRQPFEKTRPKTPPKKTKIAHPKGRRCRELGPVMFFLFGFSML